MKSLLFVLTTEHSMLRKTADPGNLLYSAGCHSMAPAVTRSGCDAHTVPPLYAVTRRTALGPATEPRAWEGARSGFTPRVRKPDHRGRPDVRRGERRRSGPCLLASLVPPFPGAAARIVAPHCTAPARSTPSSR